MKQILLTIIILIVIVGCSNSKKQNTNDETIENYENNSEFKRIVHYTDFDGVYYYYRSGTVFRNDKQYNEKQIFGKWLLYDAHSNIRKIRE
jgi:hypothetical protein